MTTEELRPQDAKRTSASPADTANTNQDTPGQTFVVSTNEPATAEPPVPIEVPRTEADVVSAVADPPVPHAEPAEPSETSPSAEVAAAPVQPGAIPAEQTVTSITGPETSVPQAAPVASAASDQPVPADEPVTGEDSEPAAVSAQATDVPPVPAHDPVAEAVQTSVDTTNPQEASKRYERMRDKLGAGGDDCARGSEDVKSQRPESPEYLGPIDIPGTDDLDASIEEQINAALTGTTEVAAAGVSVPADAASSEHQQLASPPTADAEVGPGSKVKGIVQQIHNDDVFLEAGLRNSVVVPLRQFPKDKPPIVGDELDVVIDSIDEDELLRARLPRAKHKAGGDWSALSSGQVVDCIVTGTNKGGLQITVSNLKGFLPASQVDLGYVSDLGSFVGQKLAVEVTEVNPKKRNLVVSRRKLLQAEREEASGEFWKTLEVGQELEGTVKTIKNYGAFVSLGPIDGFLHIGEMSWSRINHPNDVLTQGQQIQVKVLKIDQEKNRVSLGMKQLVQNPWLSASENYAPERIVSGRVSRVADFGAFVELEPGVEGLVHISELAWRRVASVKEVLNEGETREFKILEVDPKRKRVSLSLKALEQRPETDKPHADAPDEPPAPRREPNPDLRGGMGGQSAGGGLFGNPSDFS